MVVETEGALSFDHINKPGSSKDNSKHLNQWYKTLLEQACHAIFMYCSISYIVGFSCAFGVFLACNVACMGLLS